MINKRNVFNLMMLSLFFSCGKSKVDNSQLSIMNGKETSAYPEVVKLDNGCSAVFVSNSVMLTAAHCVESNGVSFRGQNSLDVIVGSSLNDIAIARFRNGTSEYFAKIARKKAGFRDRVTMVGYGAAFPGGRGTGVKRVGYNTVKTNTFGYIFLGGNGATVLPGDSGSPLFNEDGEIVGIASFTTADLTAVDVSGYVDALSRSSNSVYAQAEQSGFDF